MQMQLSEFGYEGPMAGYSVDMGQATTIGGRALAALAILIVTWILAKIFKWIFARLVDRIPVLQREAATGQSVGASLGKIVSLIVWLFGLIAILQVLNLPTVMMPIQNLLDSMLGFLPNLIGAGIIFYVGMVIARIVKDITVTALQTANVDKWVSKAGGDELTDGHMLSNTLGNLVYVFIFLLIGVAALQALNIVSITVPATQMLQLVLLSIPNILVAAALLGIGYLISKFVVDIIKQVLPGIGIDKTVGSLGILPEGTTASGVIARITQIAIMLFAAIGAVQKLGFPQLTEILNQIIELGGRVVFGSVVIMAGFMIANLLGKVVGGVSESKTAPNIVQWATTVLFIFMGLSFMGVGQNIVNMAFGALMIGGAVAAALAFGLGGREAAAKALDDLRKK